MPKTKPHLEMLMAREQVMEGVYARGERSSASLLTSTHRKVAFIELRSRNLAAVIRL